MKRSFVIGLIAALAMVPCAASAQMATTPSTRAEPADGSSSRLLDARDIIGMWIKDELDKTVGTVADLLVDPNTGRISHVVVGLGGVLGVGEKKVVIPWDDLKAAMRTDGAKPTATMNEAKLEGAPRYEAGASTGRDGTPSSPSASPAVPQRRTRQK